MSEQPTSNLVSTLREVLRADPARDSRNVRLALSDAIGEIERLRAALERIMHGHNVHAEDMQKLAAATLAGAPDDSSDVPGEEDGPWAAGYNERAGLCPHGMRLADNTCGPCSKGLPNKTKPEHP